MVVGPSLGGGRSEEFENHRDHFYLALGLEERLVQEQLGEDTPDGPHVDSSRVCRCPQKDLRGAARVTGKIESVDALITVDVAHTGTIG